MVAEQNPYAVLGLLQGSSAAEIKRRYRQLAKQHHPDANSSVGAEDRLRELNAAYALLSDSARKAAYDAALAAQNAVFVPVRLAQPMPWIPRRRGMSLRRGVGITLLLLLSLGIGGVFSAENAPALSGWFSQITGKTAAPGPPAPSYTFLPSHGAFDGSSSSPAPTVSAPGAPAQSGVL